jgi:hypothetical protein
MVRKPMAAAIAMIARSDNASFSVDMMIAAGPAVFADNEGKKQFRR